MATTTDDEVILQHYREQAEQPGHDAAPTILSFLGVNPPVPMDGQDLTPLLAGNGPERPRDHITQGYFRYICVRDKHRVMFCLGDMTDAHLFDAINDADQRRDKKVRGT